MHPPPALCQCWGMPLLFNVLAVPYASPTTAAPCRLAEAAAELKAGREEAARRAAAAESAAAEARARVEQLAEEAQNLRDAVK